MSKIFSHLLLIAPLITLLSASALAQKPELVIQTGHTLSLIDDDPTGSLDLVFAPDSKTIASGSTFDIKIWNVDSGQLVYTFHVPSVRFGYRMIYSASAGHLAAFDWHAREATVWNLKTGKPAFDEPVEMDTGRQTLRRLGFDLRAFVQDDAEDASPADGKAYNSSRTLYAVQEGGGIAVWDARSNQRIRSFGSSPNVTGRVEMSRDGRYMAFTLGSAANIDGLEGDYTIYRGGETRVIVWDTKASAPRRLEGTFRALGSVRFSPDEKYLAADESPEAEAAADKVRVWDVKSGALLHTLEGEVFLFFGHDGQKFFTADVTNAEGERVRPSSVNLRDCATGNLIKKIEANRVSAFDGGRKLLSRGARSDTLSFKMWDADTLTPEGELTTRRDSSDIWSVFVNENKEIVVIGRMGTDFFDLKSGALLRRVSYVLSLPGQESKAGAGKEMPPEPDEIPFTYVSESPDRKRIASIDFGGNRGYTCTFLNLETGAAHFFADTCTSPEFGAGGKLLAAGGVYGGAVIADGRTGKRLHALDSPGWIYASSFTADGKLLATVADDGAIRFFSTATGKLVATLIVVGENEWVAVTPDGYFDGTPSAWNRIGWRFPNDPLNVLPVEAFFSEFYYPGLLPALFSHEKLELNQSIGRKDRRQPRLKISPAGAQAPAAGVESREVTLSINVAGELRDKDHQTGSGAKDVRLFRNGSLVRVWRGDVLKEQKSVTLEATIAVVAGENIFTAYAFNHDNVKSSDATLIVRGADNLKRKGTAYVLAVGVNRYSNSQYDLKYAVADVREFEKEFESQQARLGRYEKTEIISLSDERATKRNILDALQGLARKIQPEDVLAIYFSGHGTAQGNRFYLLPHDLGYTGERVGIDAAGLNQILSHSISDVELELAVEGIDAGQIVMVIDACNSGQALEAEEKRRGPMNSKGLAQLAYEKGMYILTASQSFQAAHEAERLGHGFLTFALIEEGLKNGRADKDPKDSQILVREWFDYAAETVPRMQITKMEQCRDVKKDCSFIEGEEKIREVEKRGLQVPRVFYRRELEAQPLVIARP